MERTKKTGLPPIYDRHSKVLILGSFPSKKSREISFYYGNKQNRFWKMICSYFGEEIPEEPAEKKEFLLRHNIALWDMVTACEIEGSADASIQREEKANLTEIFQRTRLNGILLNGKLAYELFMQSYPNCPITALKMPSTSPANPRYDEKIWKQALDTIFNVEDKKLT